MVNIASTGAYQSVPNMALYAASKAFVRNFSEGLHDEHRGTPLSVTCICPGGTETAFHAASGGGDYSWIANASTKSAEFVAHAAIRAMLAASARWCPGCSTSCRVSACVS
jgi:short-subunit dehydrogenase